LDRLDGVEHTLELLTRLTQQLAKTRENDADDPSDEKHQASSRGVRNRASLKSTSSTSSLSHSDFATTLPGSCNDSGIEVPHEHDETASSNSFDLGLYGYDLRTLEKTDRHGQRMCSYTASLTLFRSLSKHMVHLLLPADSGSDKNSDGGENSYDSHDALVPRAISPDPALQATLRRQLDSLPFAGYSQGPSIMSDDKPIATPPRMLVDLFIDSFIRNINTQIPVFDSTSLRTEIQTFYSTVPPGPDTRAWALICTNIVLLGLGLEAQGARATQSGSTSSMNEELMSSCLRNCDRALANLEAFTRPCVANVQALLTLV
jgi:hypothetical protein